MRSLVAWLCSAACVLLAGQAWSCSPPVGDVPELTKAQSAHFADTIVVGKILETYADSSHFGDDVYWATMKIYCIYKGEVSTSVINITDVGIIPGMCHSTSLQKGSEYIVYLRKQHNQISDVEIENTEQHRLDVSKACGLHLRYPQGISKEDLPHSCPEPASDDECTPRYVPDTDHEDHGHDHDSHSHESHDTKGHGHEGHGHGDFDHDGHEHVGHTHEEHDQHDEEDKKEHGEHDDEHAHDGHDHDGHDHRGHGHDDYDHDGHAHVGHTHEEHDQHDEEHEHEHDGEHDHEHDGHEHDDHGHGGHDDDDGHDHDEYDHKGHEHKGHTHEEHDKHDEHHEDEHEHTVKAGAAHGSDGSSASQGSCAIGVLLLALGISLSL